MLTTFFSGRNNWNRIFSGSLSRGGWLRQIEARLCGWKHWHHTGAGRCWHQVSTNWGKNETIHKQVSCIFVLVEPIARWPPASLLAQTWPYMGLISFPFLLLARWSSVSPPSLPTLTWPWQPCSWKTLKCHSCLRLLMPPVEPELLETPTLKFHVRPIIPEGSMSLPVKSGPGQGWLSWYSWNPEFTD